MVSLTASSDSRDETRSDFADGLGHPWDSDDPSPLLEDEVRYREHATRVYLRYPAEWWSANRSVIFEYDASDPSLITAEQTPSGATDYSFPAGKYRLFHEYRLFQVRFTTDPATGVVYHTDANKYKSILFEDGTIYFPRKHGNGGAYIPPAVPIPLQTLDPEFDGVVELRLHAVRPSQSVGQDEIRVRLADQSLWSGYDSAKVTALQFSVHDYRHWGPFTGSPPTLSPTTTDLTQDINVAGGTTVAGAIADGSSICVIRCTPSLAGRYLTVHGYLGYPSWLPSRGEPSLAYNAPTPWLGLLRGEPNRTLHYAPRVPVDLQGDPQGFRFNTLSEGYDGNFLWVPPDEFIDASTRPPGDRFNFGLTKEEYEAAFTVASITGPGIAPSRNSWGSRRAMGVAATLRIRRPPVVFVHGITGSAKGYFGEEFANEATDTPVPSRLYFADYSQSHVAGFDVNWPVVPATIAQALNDYRIGNDDIGMHTPWLVNGGLQHVQSRAFNGRRYAATRADVVAHSMGGQLTRLYVSGLDGIDTPREWVDGVFQDTWLDVLPDAWPNLVINRLPNERYLRPDNFDGGDIRRFVSVGTPYGGSMPAVLSTIVDGSLSGMAFRLKLIENGIVTRDQINADMQEDSLFAPSGWHDLLPWSNINKKMREATYPANARSIHWFPIATKIEPFEWPGIIGINPLSPTARIGLDLSQIPRNFNSDGIVTIDSGTHRAQQRGLLYVMLPGWGHSPGTPGDPVPSQVHSGVVAAEVGKRLGGKSTQFNTTGLRGDEHVPSP